MNEKFDLCVSTLTDGIVNEEIKERLRKSFISSISDACYSSARVASNFNEKDALVLATDIVNILIH